jgi:hypothetical protein
VSVSLKKHTEINGEEEAGARTGMTGISWFSGFDVLCRCSVYLCCAMSTNHLFFST